MYNIPYFKTTNNEEIISFMQQHPFVVLCGCNADGKPVATHVPVLFDQREDALYLLGHIMKQTDHHKAFLKNKNVLAVFNGPHTYVSASWYTEPKTASTWNYITVHAKGELNFLNEKGLIDILKKLTARFENNENSPALFDELTDDYVQHLLPAIIAFEIKVTSIENVFKLSQNRDEKSYENIIHHLKEQDKDAQNIADEMMKRKDQLFN